MRVLGIIVAGLAAASCGGSSQRDDPCSAQSALSVGMDEFNLEVEKKVPGFAGLYIEAEYQEGGPDLVHHVFVWLKDLEQATLSRPALDEALTELQLPTDRTEFLQAQYSWPELMGYRETMNGAFALFPLRTSDTDERINRVSLGIADTSLSDEVLRYARDQGIPDGAVVVHYEPPGQLKPGCRH